METEKVGASGRVPQIECRCAPWSRAVGCVGEWMSTETQSLEAKVRHMRLRLWWAGEDFYQSTSGPSMSNRHWRRRPGRSTTMEEQLPQKYKDQATSVFSRYSLNPLGFYNGLRDKGLLQT